jgi:hypothetical protein
MHNECRLILKTLNVVMDTVVDFRMSVFLAAFKEGLDSGYVTPGL